MALKPMTNSRPFLKMAFTGFAGDGKTFTAAMIAAGLHKMIKSTKPVAFFDTEKASKALKPFFDAQGIEVLVDDENRSLTALNQTIKACEQGAADILIIDTITHVWEEFVNSYMQQKGRSRLEFQDWGVLKPRWKTDFSTYFVQAPVHIIFTGRAGYEYGQEKNEDTGKREIYKSGVKMKAETETAFEPDILVYMEKDMDLLSDNKRIFRTATILKDRTTLIDGLTLNKDGAKKGPDFADFLPAIKALLDGVVITAKEAAEIIRDNFEDDDKKALIRYRKQQIMAEVDGHFETLGLGSSTTDKQLKGWTLKQVFGVTAKEKLNDLNIDDLEQAFNVFKKFVTKYTLYLEECKTNKTPPTGEAIKQLMAEAKPYGELSPLITDAFNDTTQADAEKKRREVIMAEIEGTYQLMGLGTSAADKKLKAWIPNQIWGANSLEKVKEQPVEDLDRGLYILRTFSEYFIDHVKDLKSPPTDLEAERYMELSKDDNAPSNEAKGADLPTGQPEEVAN